MITRLDDELHAKLKAHAAAEDRSVNDLVIDVLTEALDGKAGRRAIRERAKASGRLVVPEPDADEAPDLDEVIESTRGLGSAASEALDAERSAR
jgi:plasmid stability protein